MTIVLYDPVDSTYYIVDQTNTLASSTWQDTIDKALTDMRFNALAAYYYAITIDEYRKKYPNYEISYLDSASQPYEFW